MHAQLIHTHRQFKVQYSTFATGAKNETKQNKTKKKQMVKMSTSCWSYSYYCSFQHLYV